MLQDPVTASSSSHMFKCLTIMVNVFLLDLIFIFLSPSGFTTVKLIIEAQHVTPAFSILLPK